MGRIAKNKQRKNHIYEYYQGIVDGTYTVGEYVRRIYQYLIEGFEAGAFVYDAKGSNQAIEWIESHCFHTEGKLAPQNIRLEVWQKALVSAMYGIKDKNGNPQFREIVLVVARKNGKSLLATSIGNYTFRAGGGYGAKVYCIAPKLDQADIVYNNMWQMVTLDPEWIEAKEKASIKDKHNKRVFDDALVARHRQSDLFIPGTNAAVKKIAFSSRKSDGFNPSLTICDEVASWQGDQGLKQYEVMKSGMGARDDGRVLSCTTSGYINDSIYDELIKRSTRFLSGESGEKRLLPILYMIDDVDKWNDINELSKSNPNLGVSVSVDYMLEEIAIAESSYSKKVEFLTKYCCIKQNSSTAWLSAQTIRNACGDPIDVEDYRKCYCVGGIDLSQARDLTACVIVVEKYGKLNVFAKFFMPRDRIEEATQRDGVPYNAYVQRGILMLSGDHYVDYHDCFVWFKDMVEIQELLPLKIGYDRYSSAYLVQEMKKYGFHMDDVYQGENLYGVMQETEALIEGGIINIGDNDLMKMHLLNSAIKMSTERGRGKLIKVGTNLRIDGTAALLCAMTMRQKYHDEIGEQLKNGGVKNVAV